ncbi:Cobyrinic acid ac-diamide synthase [Solidesulfovibrio carbinoliphilus subsp. oakridgensis]|uniref:Cobyrinic acid ac-diamide synthase n=1 Tax=Solidesulfovibrio carbinoliphilus subsp. oakridgensis TaxID=694327 RepID=G7QBI9_9BACT|nr:ParA family protein [Solidesulfovibrio carbinoliphilus]EHJ48852.1 Cobyrinic acid ac-diamide synthase [Solidesulfovibrio carbinoliphilus subsp. oakridgensis]
MRIIAFANQKGGVGKTTTVQNVGAALAMFGRSVLLVDLDAQGSLTASCGVEPEELEKNLYDVLDGRATVGQIKRSVEGLAGIDLLPAGMSLAQADLAFAGRIGRENMLKKAMSQVEGYDYILLDCPPNLGLVTVNALVAAGELIIPVQAEFHALRGLELLQSTVAMIQELNPTLRAAGIVVTLYDKRKTLNRDVFNELRRAFPDLIFETRIRDAVALAEAPSHGKDIMAYRPGSAGAEDYERLAKEIEKRGA